MRHSHGYDERLLILYHRIIFYPVLHYFLNLGWARGFHQLNTELFGSIEALAVGFKVLFHDREIFYVSQKLFKQFCMLNCDLQTLFKCWSFTGEEPRGTKNAATYHHAVRS